MRTKNSNRNAKQSGDVSLGLPVPIRSSSLFKHSASAPVLNFLADNPEFDLSVRQLSRLTAVSPRATGDAVDALVANDLVEVHHRGNARRVQINRERLSNIDDPVERIPQVPYRTPVRVITHYIKDELDGLLGIVHFGSVARGDADRQSDIDLWILVDCDLLAQRNEANRLARELEGLQIPPKISLKEARNEDFTAQWDDIRAQLEADDTAWDSAQRHSVEFIVETPDSFRQQSHRVDPVKLFQEGITLDSSDTLDELKREVLSNE